MQIIYQSSVPQIGYGSTSWSSYVSYDGTKGITLEDLLKCCENNTKLLLQILRKLNLRGFRRDKPTRKDLAAQNQEILTEMRTIKRLIRRRDELPGGGYNGPNEPIE